MLRPTIHDLAQEQRTAAAAAARALNARGYKAWIVGGAVRDLAVGRSPKDVDLATDALPSAVEECFPRTVAVGKAFGTIIVLLPGSDAPDAPCVELQITTLRRDREYSDGRRPSGVLYGTSIADDAARRDFTCNALYLDPLSDEVLDPCGGLPDLDAGKLRTVGEPEARFREDGLRLLRLARFAAAYDLTIDDGTWEGARASLDSLRGVSRERVLDELTGIADCPAPARALEVLASSGVLDRLLPGLEELHSPFPDGGSNAEQGRAGVVDARIGLIRLLGRAVGITLLLTVLLEPDGQEQQGHAEELLDSLRPSRDTKARVLARWSACRRLHGILAEEDLLADDWRARARRVSLASEEAFTDAVRLEHARAGGRSARCQAFEEWVGAQAPAQLDPEPLLTSADLAEEGVPRSPFWGQILREADERRLGGADATRAEALAWLRARIPKA